MKPSHIALAIGMASAASTAAAADLDSYFAPPDSSTPSLGLQGADRWQGMHVGVNGGGFLVPNTKSSIDWFPTPTYLATTGIPSSMSMRQSGVLGGAQIGYAQQWGMFVLGGEADYDMASSRTINTQLNTTFVNSSFGDGTGYTLSERQSLRSLGTIRANVGVAPTSDLLIYATGGLAFGIAESSSSLAFGSGLTYSGERTNMLVGFAVGGGVEYALDSQWSIGLQGLYYDLGKTTSVGIPNVVYPSDEISPETDSTADFKGFTLRLTANYQFGGESAPTVFPGASPPEVKSEFGARAGMATTRARMSLYDGTGSMLISRLTYHDAQATTAEIFGRLDDASGLFAKGFLGAGQLGDGTFQDEDFPPTLTPYSSTNSAQRFGQLGYGVADVGYYGLSQAGYKLGGLAGFTYLAEKYNAYGCTQTATNTSVCTPGLVASYNLGLSDDNNWKAARLGLVAEADLPHGFTIRGEAVWLPFISFNGENDHYLRIPQDFSGPIPSTASGHLGYQLEGEVDYALSRNFSIGVGARYWSLEAKGDMNFQYATNDGGPQVATFSTQILQAFAQSSYRF